MERDRGPERIRLEIRTNRGMSVTFLGEERTRVESSDTYIRSDEHAMVLTRLSECQNELAELKEAIKHLGIADEVNKFIKMAQI